MVVGLTCYSVSTDCCLVLCCCMVKEYQSERSVMYCKKESCKHELLEPVWLAVFVVSPRIKNGKTSNSQLFKHYPKMDTHIVIPVVKRS